MKTAPLTALFVILLATTTIQSQPDTRKPSGTKTETAEAKKDEAEIRRWMDRWVTLQLVLDDEERETLTLTDRTATLPAELLVFFMPVGIRLEEWS